MLCPNGHANPDEARYCAVCGSQVGAPPAPVGYPAQAGAVPPPVQGPPPGFAHPASAPEPARSRRGRWLLLGGAAVVLVAIVAVAAVVLSRGSGSTGPMTATQAQAAMLSAADLVVTMRPSVTSEDSLAEDDAFEPDETPSCTPIVAASRVSDIPTDLRLGTPVFPGDVRSIVLFEGVDYEDTSEDVVSSFDERILVFPSAAEATAYLTSLAAALEACPTRTYFNAEDSIVASGTYRYQPTTVTSEEVSWDTATEFSFDSDLDVLDFTIASDEGTTVLQRGPNVLVASWYRDQDDPAPISDFQASMAAAKARFLSAAAGG